MSALPGRHDGETVVEPGMVDGDEIDMAEAGSFVKKVPIEAVQMHARFHAMTAHGRVTGSAGDWLARNPVTGERWPILAADFASNYEPVEEQTP